MSLKICAVVVTYNRKELLTRTLDALLAQTIILDEILIIDNASTDGTKEFIEEKKYFEHKNVSYELLSENTGGAGGFYQGVKQAYEKGYDWIWLMDDDGYPATNDCLETLLKAQHSFDLYGPLVINDNGDEDLSFSFPSSNFDGLIENKETAIKISNEADNFTYIKDIIAPFNGILVKRNVVAKIGFPDPRLFIWGDEINYWMRCGNAGFRIGTLTNCYFYHPKAPNNNAPILFNKKFVNDPPSPLKLYCYCRNYVYNYKNLRSNIHVAWFTFKTVWFYSLSEPSPKKLKIAAKAMKDGYFEDFTHHQEYLGKSFEDY